MSTSTPAAAAAPTVRPLTTREADGLIEAAARAAEGLGVRGSVTVLDAGGHLLGFRRDYAAVLISGETSTRKAYTALQLDTPTADLVDLVRPEGLFHTLPTALDRPLLFLAGGAPLHRDGRLIGALGFGGGSPEQDHRIAVEAIAESGLA
ncbi:heme-binding protein [Streptomyces sioyaensis]|uniref:GlcG/HbpS family heme-binding protein n=1 Tax=Streptomyces sioyaensis TaxID=67364 RepID=UPI0033E09902